MKFKIITLMVSALFSANLKALDSQESVNSMGNRPDSSNGWSVSLGHLNLEEKNAFAEGIKDTAFYLRGAWEGNKDQLVYGAGLTIAFLSDNDSFSVVVEDYFGDVSTASSDATAFGGFGEIGYSMPFESNNASFDILGGVELLWAERGITNCSNCPSEDINLDGGLYFKPRFRFFTSSTMAVSIAYQHYLSADIENGISVDFSWHY
ncbi:hypothetical protein [Aliikangiella sp. G2MR2-5]|uniref:hypothetical protein n=1 Tax=Aliikangiella sp. G2MR2-5 TaxID=2788943 RepID=UPI0018AB3BC7|nr:hypothetical protein [Aliikangiella sp. G2MR2-5]